MINLSNQLRRKIPLRLFKQFESTNRPTYQTPENVVNLDKFGKYILKNFGKTKYASINDVPTQISAQTFTYAKDRARAKISLYLIGLTCVGAGIAIYRGRHDRDKGISRNDLSFDEHMKYSKMHQNLDRNTRLKESE